MMQIEKQREEYYKQLGTPPGVPTMKGATADPDNKKWQTGNVVGSTTVCRSPMRISIDVYYDDELRQIEISSDVGVEVQLFLCDINGNTLDYSHCINTVLDIPYRYSGIIILRI